MPRLHSTFIAFVLGAAAAAGLFAAVHTVRLGQAAAATRPATVPAHVIAVRRAKLARWSRSLEHALAKRPPALPKLPKYAPVQIPAAPAAAPVYTAPAAPAAAAAAPAVTYKRAPTVVKYRHAEAKAGGGTQSSSGGQGEPEDQGDDGGQGGSAGGGDNGGDGGSGGSGGGDDGGGD